MKTEFIERFEAHSLTGADYNPRIIEKDKIEKLKESISKFGMIKPLIINGKNGVLTAGHQRITAARALGITHVPVIRLKEIDRHDEIRFNLFHNSIETSASQVVIEGNLPPGYSIIPPDKIKVLEHGNAVITKEIGYLMLRYDEWGSVVCDEQGRVFLNADYAAACSLLQKELLCFVVKTERVEELLEYLSLDYGAYYYEKLGVKTCNQMYCQMHRSAKGDNPVRQLSSSTYEEHVLPRINKTMRILDFGAGECAYVDRLQAEGYKILAYEPNYRTKGASTIDMKKVVQFIRAVEIDVKANGLFDTVVLDSVLNSVINEKVERDVVLTCAGLLKPDGMLIVGTRNLELVKYQMTHKRDANSARKIEFLDSKNFSAIYRNGLWTMQHFHTLESLGTLLQGYFEDVETFGNRHRPNIYAVAHNKKEINIPALAAALECEFNFEYDEGYKHNKHTGLVAKVLEFNQPGN